MRHGESSRTAESIALYRALDLALNADPIIRDPWAARMLRTSYRIPVQSRLIRSLYLRFRTDIRPMMVTSSARSAIAEDVLAQKAAQGPVQWVLLGAGLDMFAWRHPEHAQLAQFEVDHPATQGHKRSLIAKLGLKPPANHRFVSIDFEKTSISNALRAAGFDPAVPAVFAWLGVTYYLTRPAIDTTLADVASIAAPGSVMVCDYRVPDRHIDPRDAALQRKGDKVIEKWGEPHITKLEPDVWPALVSPAGWSIEEDAGPAELTERFTRMRPGLRPISNYRVLTLRR